MRLPVQLVCILIAGSVAGAALGSPESRSLLSRGAVDLSQDRFEAALATFQAASKADPADSEAVYLQAVAQNRLGRHGEALALVDQATQLGYAGRDVALERGWALIGLGRHAEGIASLSAYEKTEPGRGQTSLLLGQAHLGQGDTVRARAEFAEAIKRDPSLTARATRLQEETEPSNERPLGSLVGSSPRSETFNQRAERGAIRPARDTVQSTTWSARPRGAVGLGAGNNSNVISLGDSTLAGEISQTSDSYIQAFADLSYDWQFNAKDGLTIGYYGQANKYDDLQLFDLIDHTGYITYRHLFTPRRQFTFSVADSFTQLGGFDFRNIFSLRPAMTWLLDDGDAIEVAAYYSNNGYFFPTIPVFNRDGDTLSGSITHYFHIEKTRLTGRVGYYHLWNSTVGSDFDFDSDGVLFGLNHPIGKKGANAAFFYSHTWDDYDNPNSLVGFLFARADESDRYSFQLSAPLQPRISVYGRYERIDISSNVPAFAFDQDIVSGGLVASF